jgi:hypothetical protein
MKLETYEAAIAAIEKTRNKVSKRVSANTTLYKIVAVDGTVTVGVKLYDTFVVIMHPDHSVLFSGGYKTSTTKKRINNYSLCSIFQKDFEWFVKDGTPFEEGIVVDRGGGIAIFDSSEFRVCIIYTPAPNSFGHRNLGQAGPRPKVVSCLVATT